MNVHHLELFYYVARHGGISEAVRKMPYGIQQPAICAQVLQLEEPLGVTVFKRRPFALTESGQKLYRFIEPFFSNLDAMAVEIRGETVHHLRIAASQAVLRDHLPELIRGLRRQFPQLRILLREGHPLDLESLLQQREIDLAITALGGKTAPATHCQPLLELPLVLLAPKNSSIKDTEALWKRDRINEPLICLPAGEIICKAFQERLGKRGVVWPPSIEVSSLSLVESYVASGFGIGLSVASPTKCPASIRELPLSGFDPIRIGAIWRGKLPPVARALLETVVQRAREFQ
jgi:DNA-binding transcriptional LysR family regulator